jgi:polyhydroxybutyrate depolymerase
MLSPGDQIRSLDWGGSRRSYLVHVPPQHDPARPTSIVLIFHGGGTNAKTMVRFSGLSETADQAGFLAVYPSGTGHNPNLLTWNGGNCCGYAMRQQTDDVGFVRALLDDLAAVAPLDERRIFATGMSNGGVMAYRLASDLSDRIAAIASVSGPMGTDTCRPNRPVPVIHFHGTADEFAPYNGGRGPKSFSQVDFRSVDWTIEQWIAADGCPAKGSVIRLPQGIDDPTSVTRTTWGPGRAGSEVVLYTIEGGGHTWPGRMPFLKLLGPSTTAISANDVMWAFFTRHPRK